MFCPKCGSELPDGAPFCGKCGHQVSAGRSGETKTPTTQGAARTAPTRMAATPTATTGSSLSGVSIMPIVRIVISAIIFAMLFIPWVEYRGAITGTTGINFSDTVGLFSNGWALSFPLYIGLILLVVGAVVDLAAKRAFGRWLCLIGCILILLVSIILPLLFATDTSISLLGYSVASVQATLVPGVCIVLTLVGAVTCFIKR